MPFTTRRILTAHDAQGRSMIASVDEIASAPGKMQAGVHRADLWGNSMPPALTDNSPAAGGLPMLPQSGGAIFRMMELEPGSKAHMHKTMTLDFVVVTEGEVTMLLEDGGIVTMKPCDTMIQRATLHGWENRGAKPCKFATVIFDATPERSA